MRNKSSRTLCIEVLSSRIALSAAPITKIPPDIHSKAGTFNRRPVAAMAALAEAQYHVQQTPRIQLGNAPLVGTPEFVDSDQIEIMWQTIPAGDGKSDSFQVAYRDPESSNSEWIDVGPIQQVDAIVDGRVIHSAVLRDLQWNHRYEYRVQHWRSGTIVQEYQNTFRTRLAPGDETPFTFAAYGDSAILDERLANFRKVQSAINQSNADFSVLLGDNIYDSGTHREADARFNPDVNPEATEWIASHVDYFAIGNHDVGIASQQSFSMPILMKGVDAYSDPPDGAIHEFYSSFDYGSVHFVTFDSNSAELSRGDQRDELIRQQVDFLVQDLSSSQADWKIVYMHHPLVGSVKLQLYPDTNYLEFLLPALADAGVDLVMSGDSHTFAWTYPLSGFTDQDQNAEVADSEVEFNAESATDFVKGSGTVHLISGVGGKSLRNDPFGQPYMAAAYSESPNTAPVEFGFAKIDVTAEQLVVSYISAESQHIVGDLDHDGVRDPNEAYFAQFSISRKEQLIGDVNDDGSLTAVDIDLLCAAILGNDDADRFDLTKDGVVNFNDYDFLVRDVMRTSPGDANLDGVADQNDLRVVFVAGEYEDGIDGNSSWAEGDWNCNGDFTTSDLVAMFQNIGPS